MNEGKRKGERIRGLGKSEYVRFKEGGGRGGIKANTSMNDSWLVSARRENKVESYIEDEVYSGLQRTYRQN